MEDYVDDVRVVMSLLIELMHKQGLQLKNCRNLNCDYHRSRPLKSEKQHLDKLELFWKERLWAEEVKFECFGHSDKQEGGI